MNALPLALSLTSSFTQVGAIAGFAALVGIAMLSLLAFSQAREIKRLREWAGRAPERAAEMEQRVSAEAAARMQRAGQPLPAAARVIPRKTPLVSAPVSTAVNATVASVIPSADASPQGSPVGPPLPGASVQGTPALPTSGVQSPSEAKSPVLDPEAEGQEPRDAEQDPPAVEGALAASANGEAPGAVEVSATEHEEPAIDPGAPDGDPDQQVIGPREDAEQHLAPAPATAAARAVGAAARPSLPPSPSAPAPPAGVGLPVAASNASALPAAAGASEAARAPRPTSRPPAPIAASSPVASRAVAGSAAGGRQVGSPSPRGGVASAASATASGASRQSGGAAVGGSGPKYFRPERSPVRATAMIVGGVIIGVLVIAFAVSELGGGGKSSSTVTRSSSSAETGSARTHTPASATPSKPSETVVVVLNGTSTNGLAHHLAGDLQQSGYTRAAASAAVPPGTHATTVVEYTNGHRADGQAVAKALDVNHVQPMEASTASLARSATVVVLAGADQAAQLGGGGAQSKGEPEAGATGEATGAAGEAGAGAGGAAGEGSAGGGQ
jgi:hypothetical protein